MASKGSENVCSIGVQLSTGLFFVDLKNATRLVKTLFYRVVVRSFAMQRQQITTKSSFPETKYATVLNYLQNITIGFFKPANTCIWERRQEKL
jgi:hypothetical protein